MDNTRDDRLSRIIRGRIVVVLLHGASLKTFEDQSKNFSDLDLCYCSLNNFKIAQDILKKIGRDLSFIWYSCDLEVGASEPLARIEEFLAESSERMFLTTIKAMAGRSEFFARFLLQILVTDLPKIPKEHFPNSFGALLLTILRFGQPSKIVLFGADGCLHPTFDLEQVTCSYHPAALLKPEEYDRMRDGRGISLTKDTLKSNRRLSYFIEDTYRKYGGSPIEILNCSPDSKLTSFRKLSIKDLLNEINSSCLSRERRYRNEPGSARAAFSEEGGSPPGVKSLADQYEAILIEEGYLGFNLFRYKRRYYGIAQGLWPMRLSTVNDNELEDWRRRNRCVEAESLTELMETVMETADRGAQQARIADALFSASSVAREMQRLADLKYESFPVLVEQTVKWSVIWHKGVYYLVRKRIGYLDFAGMEQWKLERYVRTNECIVAQSYGEVQLQLNDSENTGDFPLSPNTTGTSGIDVTAEDILHSKLLYMDLLIAEAKSAIHRNNWADFKIAIYTSMDVFPDFAGAELIICEVLESLKVVGWAAAAVPVSFAAKPYVLNLYKNLGLNRYARGAIEAAQEVFGRILSQIDNDVDALGSLGRISSHLGQHEEALRYFRKAVQMNPDDSDMRMELCLLEKQLSAFGPGPENWTNLTVQNARVNQGIYTLEPHATLLSSKAEVGMHIKRGEKPNVLFISLEFRHWRDARYWSYPLGLGLEEGLSANQISFLTLPAIFEVPSSSPNSWLFHARSICAGRKFDQVWFEMNHSNLQEDFLDWVGRIAPVRVGFFVESLEISGEEYANNPKGALRRNKNIDGRLGYLTHGVVVDENDVNALSSRGVPAIWWPPSVPERYICDNVGPVRNRAALYFGAVYGERKEWLEHPDLRQLLIRPEASPEDSTGFPELFDQLNQTAEIVLQSKLTVGMDELVLYMDSLRKLRRGCFFSWLEGLRAGCAVVNLPQFGKMYSGRVVESMAAGRPVIAAEIAGRPRTMALFENTKEILLYSRTDRSQLRNHISDLLKYPDRGQQIAANARRKLRHAHTTERRVEQVLRWMENGEDSVSDAAANCKQFSK
ncbi:MAG: Methyltransf 21 protein [Bacteroidetes bacterium]|nr:Methyltransf 21 protein [Bacteroidota bacterium]